MTDHVRSWYAATSNRAPDFPRLEGDHDADVCVVGGGFTGLSAALNLAESGYDVALVEGARVGWGASGRNGGQVLAGYNKPMAQVSRWVGEDNARKLWDMQREATDIIRDRVTRHAIDCDLKWGAILAGCKPRHERELALTAEEWSRHGHTGWTLLDRQAMSKAVDSPRYLSGLHDRDSGHIHPLNYALGLARAARQAGVKLFERSRAERMEPGERPVIHTSHGKVRARHVILAGNAYLGPFARSLKPRIMPVGTYIIGTEPMGEDRASALIPGDEAVSDINFVLNYFRRSRDHRFLFGGGVSYSGLEAPISAGQLRRRMIHYFPQLSDLTIEYVWGGHVAITINRMPDFGQLDKNVYYAQGFSGHGVALTGLAGKLMAEAVAGTAERFDVFARIPHRPFPGGSALRTPALVLAMLWYRLRDLV